MKILPISNISTLLCCIVIPLLVFNISVYGQEAISFKHITTTDGLSQSDVNAIYQDKFGYMWFGTHDGLNKYDGYGFTVYNPDNEKPDSINSNLIYDIVGDDEGNLWIGTTGSGLNFFNATTGKFTSYRNKEDDSGSLSSDHITALYLDSKKRLWIGSRNGLDMVDLSLSSKDFVFKHYNSEQAPFIAGWDGTSIYTIYEDKNSQLLVGSASGLFKLAKDANGQDYFGSITNTIGLPNTAIRDLTEDALGRLLVATGQGVFAQVKGQGENLQKLYDGNFSALLVDNENRIWVGSNEGLLLFENTSGDNLPKFLDRFVYDSRNPASISKNIIKSLFLDSTGIIWIGTNGGGVNTFDPGRKKFRHIRNTSDPNSLSYDKIRAMYEDGNGTLWIGTEGGGLNMLTKKKDNGSYSSFKHFNSLQRTFALTETQIGKRKVLFIGTESSPGLFQLDISDPTKVSENNLVPQDLIGGVFSLLTDSEQNIWIGTYGSGVHRWMRTNNEGEYEKEVFSHYNNGINSVPSNIIRNILEDSEGNIWLATGNGLSMISAKERYKKRPKFLTYKNDPENTASISHNYILFLYESNAGDLWIGTFGGGLNKLVKGTDGKEDSFVSYSEKNGLPNNVIKGILEDDNGNLWLSTNKGLSKFDPLTENFKNYNESDGLQDNEFQELACVKRLDGEMLFGGINGFNAFYPEDIGVNEFPAKTVITDLLIFNKSVEIGEEINGRVILDKNINKTNKILLEYGENNFSFEFAALHYAAPSKNQFAYMLEGFDTDWTYTSSNKRFATYTNLESGTYTFKVKASNNDGFWNDTPTQLIVTIAPPWWFTHTAFVVYFLLILALLWLFYRYTFIRTSKKHQLELEHVEKEKSEELQKIKLEFFTNISHEFRTPLTLIKGPLEYLQKNVGKLENKALAEQYALMHKNTDYLLRLVGQLLDFRKLNQGKMRLVMRNSDIVAFIKDVAEPFQFMAHKQSIDFSIDASDPQLTTWFDHDALEKILNNLLSNAFKFTQKGGRIHIKISEKMVHNQKQVVIQVKDTGLGIAKDKLSSIFERFHTAKEDSSINREGYPWQAERAGAGFYPLCPKPGGSRPY